jgi:hypothetical protein
VNVFSTRAFKIERGKARSTATDADGFGVCLFDEQHVEQKKHFVDGGVWREFVELPQ